MKTITLLYFWLSLLTLLYSQTLETSSDKKENTEAEKIEETEKEKSKLRKWEFFLGGSAFSLNNISEKENGINLGIYYKINSRFSIGYSHFHSNTTGSSFTIIPIFSTYIPLSQRKFDRSKEIGILDFRFFLSTSIPFFLKLGLARDFIGSHSSTTEYGSFNNSNFILNPIVSKHDIAPNNLISGGIGYQKNFENGFLFGFDYTRMRALSPKENAHTEIYSEGIPGYLLLNETQAEHIKINRAIISFWVGYAF